MVLTRVLVALVLVAHAAIHLVGFAKAFRLARVPQLQNPIGAFAGAVWLLAAVALAAGALMLLVRSSGWWLPTVVGVVLSQALIASAWGDAKYGTIANVMVVIAVVVIAKP